MSLWLQIKATLVNLQKLSQSFLIPLNQPQRKMRRTFSIELINMTTQKFNNTNKITQNMGQYQGLINRSHKNIFNYLIFN